MIYDCTMYILKKIIHFNCIGAIKNENHWTYLLKTLLTCLIPNWYNETCFYLEITVNNFRWCLKNLKLNASEQALLMRMCALYVVVDFPFFLTNEILWDTLPLRTKRSTPLFGTSAKSKTGSMRRWSCIIFLLSPTWVTTRLKGAGTVNPRWGKQCWRFIGTIVIPGADMQTSWPISYYNAQS